MKIGKYQVLDVRAFQRVLSGGKSVWTMIWATAHEHHPDLAATMKEVGVLLTGVLMLSDSPNMANARDYQWSIFEARNGVHPIGLYPNNDGHADAETSDLCCDTIHHYLTLERAAPAAH